MTGRVTALETLTTGTGDDGLVAIAILTLVRNSRVGGIVDRLVEIAPYQDYRYQLETGYLLERIGHEAAKRFSHKGLVDENGAPVLTMDVKRNKDLPSLSDRRGLSRCHLQFNSPYTPLPSHTHAAGTYVLWVHTDPKYRRKGLSRWAFRESMSHELVRRYSGISLHTSTRNPAHAMVQEFWIP